MTGKKAVTSITTGDFTAKIQGRPDFDAKRGRVSVFFDGEYYHCAGTEENPDPKVFRTLYFHVKNNPGQPPTFHELLYIAQSGHDLEKAVAKDGTFTIDFDTVARIYKMSFDVVVKHVDFGSIAIEGSFDLRNE
ncbi:MAG TPA: hypothetical protein VNV36_09970 [Pseudomonas sp.]|uniref:hypothetical protein n=1 Tax=Pseudomonas sp. TaxID=306 RepID=UPI002BDC860F|nr:hypothetical protein [Pseudomonas sp.]HWH87090.1 hypothetical protein [Pseudomonas sp.]